MIAQLIIKIKIKEFEIRIQKRKENMDLEKVSKQRLHIYIYTKKVVYTIKNRRIERESFFFFLWCSVRISKSVYFLEIVIELVRRE